MFLIIKRTLFIYSYIVGETAFGQLVELNQKILEVC